MMNYSSLRNTTLSCLVMGLAFLLSGSQLHAAYTIPCPALEQIVFNGHTYEGDVLYGSQKQYTARFAQHFPPLPVAPKGEPSSAKVDPTSHSLFCLYKTANPKLQLTLITDTYDPAPPHHVMQCTVDPNTGAGFSCH